MSILQAVVELMILLCYDAAASSAKHAAKEGKSRERGGNVMDDGRGIKNATLHQNVTNATTPSKKEGTTKTVNGGCEDTTSTITSVPERVGPPTESLNCTSCIICLAGKEPPPPYIYTYLTLCL